MNADTFQPQTRSLAVEAFWDFSRNKTIPRIRIAGKWLELAGFKPGHRVEVRIAAPGSISLHFVETPGYTGR